MEPPPIPLPAPVGGRGRTRVRDGPGRTRQNRDKRPMFASYTPTLQDLYLLMGNPQKAVTVLGGALAAILLFWGAVYVFVTYILPWLRKP